MSGDVGSWNPRQSEVAGRRPRRGPRCGTGDGLVSSTSVAVERDNGGRAQEDDQQNTAHQRYYHRYTHTHRYVSWNEIRHEIFSAPLFKVVTDTTCPIYENTVSNVEQIRRRTVLGDWTAPKCTRNHVRRTSSNTYIRMSIDCSHAISWPCK